MSSKHFAAIGIKMIKTEAEGKLDIGLADGSNFS
jgi:hypothetical protein